MSHTRPHGFPSDTPEPFAQPYSATSALIDLVLSWVRAAAVCSAGLLIAWLVLFFLPTLKATP
jgi:hypothetical protein